MFPSEKETACTYLMSVRCIMHKIKSKYQSNLLDKHLSQLFPTYISDFRWCVDFCDHAGSVLGSKRSR